MTTLEAVSGVIFAGENSASGDIYNASLTVTTPATLHFSNLTDDEHVLYPLGWVIPISVVYAIIFLTGVVGNISTCIVIARNKSLHTVTNYYLFSIAISDLLLLISGLPPEVYHIWSPETYVFGEVFCVLQGFFAETSANATVLAITAFTVERYLAICHPFLSHTMSNLSRAIKYIIAIWIVALCLAAPQAIQFGVEYETKNGFEYSRCTVITTAYMEHAFEISSFLFFVGPMSLITALYILIAIKLRKSRVLGRNKRTCSVLSNANGGASVNNANMGAGNGTVGNGMGTSTLMATSYMDARAASRSAAQNRVIKMLVAVVVAFCICWAPFHGQRLLAVYLASASEEAQARLTPIYIALTYISGVLYFLSTSVNPVLYHIMSNKFREAFTILKNRDIIDMEEINKELKKQATFSQLCRKSHRNHHCIYDPGQQMGGLPHRTYSTIIPPTGGAGIAKGHPPPHPSQRPYQRSVSDGISQFHPLLCATSGTRFPGMSHEITGFKKGSEKKLRPIVISERCNEVEEYCLQMKEEERNNKDGSFRGRVSSEASQTTIMTNFSIVGEKKNSTKSAPNISSSRNIKSDSGSSTRQPNFMKSTKVQIHGTLQKGYVSRLRRWLKIFQGHKRRPMVIHRLGENGESKNPLSEDPIGIGMLIRQGSVESATISNSSLQDLGEMEFSSTDLMHYMEEINEDLA